MKAEAWDRASGTGRDDRHRGRCGQGGGRIW